MNKYLVFYAGLLYGEYTPEDYIPFRRACTMELNDGAYVRTPSNHWYRMNGIQLLLEEVPKELLLSVLLLT